jgi:hypothetical protein
MTTTMRSWVGPAIAVALGLLAAVAAIGHQASLAEAAVLFLSVTAYPIVVLVSGYRFDLGIVLSGRPRDERWQSIHERSLSLAAQVLAVLLAGAFLWTSIGGGDPTPYAWLGAGFAVTYLAGIVWYRARS